MIQTCLQFLPGGLGPVLRTDNRATVPISQCIRLGPLPQIVPDRCQVSGQASAARQIPALEFEFEVVVVPKTLGRQPVSGDFGLESSNGVLGGSVPIVGDKGWSRREARRVQPSQSDPLLRAPDNRDGPTNASPSSRSPGSRSPARPGPKSSTWDSSPRLW